MKKILFVAHHRLDRSPGQRYRFEQFFDFLELKGLSCHLANIITEEDEKILYESSNILKKIVVGIKSYKRRFIHLLSITKYDLVVIYREALPTRSIFFEKYISKKNIPIIFDFDDAIWVKDVSDTNKKISWFKDERKIEKLLPLCTHVTCGNEYLAAYAKKFNDKISIIPSTVDTDLYYPSNKNNNNQVVRIGWVGSHTTIKHFELIIDVFKQLKDKYQNKIDFIVIGDENYKNEKLDLKVKKWDNSMEVELFNCFDIGVMPLPKDEWAKGKCGMKGLLYMSVGKPAVMSNVGMNKQIIDHGINGYLASGHKQWFDVLSNLIEDKELRRQIGLNGRETVLSKYSKNVTKDIYYQLYNTIINSPDEKNSALQ